MADELLLVGSVPLDTAEQVFRTFGPNLGEHLAYMPDGEIGDRRYWIDGIAFRVLHGHPEIETIQRPAPDADGVETWRPQSIADQFLFKVKPGVERVRFGDPGWRLGYTRDAIHSYFVFKTLKKEGVIPDHVRFQVCMPLSYSAAAGFFPDEADHARVVPGMTAALKAEVAEMVRQIPPEDLAIQWDLAVENRYIEPLVETGDIDGAKAMAEKMSEPIAEIAEAIPDTVALGHHSCYGTLNGWPSRQPGDATGTVLLLNALYKAAGHRLDFVHFPTIGSAEETFFRPLENLDVDGARIFVGAIHHMHGTEGLRGQLEAVHKFLPDFGLAAPCGFGRVPERPGRLLTETGDGPPPDYMQVILDDHKTAVGVLQEVLSE